jgi:hypothetical protein
MAETDGQGRLFAEPAAPGGAVVINDRCLVRTRDEHRVVMVSGVVLAQYALGDRMAEGHAMVMLVEGGWADQNDVARAFGYSTRTLRRNQQRFAEGGLAALGGRGVVGDIHAGERGWPASVFASCAASKSRESPIARSHGV